ncbi:PREDICTED: vomeronasal type-2 receptor 26-like [Thamnophis sirtalis]|uniref:Vomeronasal type-2 receptor 26-like n=1 Tax=Thamnophis sirtalis TaxID=35019 RepID=A0A6I9YKN4_9SAUR|nr:PREDICTED: vomeronasal type-2 receptor 26-like [Thamnophis sirtalis]
MTLGFHIVDSYNDEKTFYHSVLQLLFKSQQFALNYNCNSKKNVIAMIAGLNSDISFQVANILTLYKVPQLAYGSFASERREGSNPSFFRMALGEDHQVQGIFYLLRNFGWTWIGLFAQDSDGAEHFLFSLEALFPQNGICSAFTQIIPQQHLENINSWNKLAELVEKLKLHFTESKASTFIIYGDTSTLLYVASLLVQVYDECNEKACGGKVWIMTDQVDFSEELIDNIHMFQGALSFMLHSSEIKAFRAFLHLLRTKVNNLEDFWNQDLKCLFSTSDQVGKKKCTREESFQSIPTSHFEMTMNGHSYSIYNGVHAVAHALQSVGSARANSRTTRERKRLQPWQVAPHSVCNEHCQPGYQKKKKEGKKFCCYDCASCPEEKISDKKGFLCPLLFLGQPMRVTCLLRQPTFGMTFSMAISCVLAKTVTGVVAFMATRPGSNMRKWVGKRLPNSIVLCCFLIQAILCVGWMTIFPPFPDLDKYSFTKRIIAECNEEPIVIFFLVLGYMGLLSIISFMVAFLARNLPESFNEAKFITFSMLVFCNIWLAFLPAYLSTKGKEKLAVEIFSILASSAGLLSCIFVPKCYIILFKPELNSKEQLTKRKN